MPGRIYFARIDEPPAGDDTALKLPAAPRHASLAKLEPGDFLLLISAAGDARFVAAQCDLARSPVEVEKHWRFSGRIRHFTPPRRLPLAAAHRFLHDGTRGPADFPGESEGGKIDAALRESRCVFDPKIRGSVPKIVQFWRWLESSENEIH